MLNRNSGSWSQRHQQGRQQRSASDTDFDWRKTSHSGDASPNNNEENWNQQPTNQVTSKIYFLFFSVALDPGFDKG